MKQQEVYELLEQKTRQYNQPNFIKDDPISIPHRFSRLQDIEIMGLWAAVLAWGQRKTIINKCNELIDLMDAAPHQFVTQHREQDLKRFENFKHRTFNLSDTLYFLDFFRNFYQAHNSLEILFLTKSKSESIENGLINFHEQFFAAEYAPMRTRKHISTPLRKSSCKRLNMFLRWMVRNDKQGVDFGLWRSIAPSQLICPCDVHVDRVARNLGLITRPTTDWLTALELTENLRKFDAVDPVKYDFALFGMGIEGYF